MPQNAHQICTEIYIHIPTVLTYMQIHTQTHTLMACQIIYSGKCETEWTTRNGGCCWCWCCTVRCVFVVPTTFHRSMDVKTKIETKQMCWSESRKKRKARAGGRVVERERERNWTVVWCTYNTYTQHSPFLVFQRKNFQGFKFYLFVLCLFSFR